MMNTEILIGKSPKDWNNLEERLRKRARFTASNRISLITVFHNQEIGQLPLDDILVMVLTRFNSTLQNGLTSEIK